MPRGFLIRRLDEPLLAFDPFHSLVMMERLKFDRGSALCPGFCPAIVADDRSPPPLDLSLKPPPPPPPPVSSTPPPAPVPAAPATASSRKRRPDRPDQWKVPKKAVRKLSFDDETTSPVSGTIIRPLPLPLPLTSDSGGGDVDGDVVRKGDIDPCYNVVEVTDEAKAELAKIENRIGDYVCRLCREVYADAFGLARHRCSRIVHIEYRCAECDKVFNCPANLASHRRWHRPRPAAPAASDAAPAPAAPDRPCPACGKLFRRRAHLEKHLLTHAAPTRQITPTPSAVY